MLCISDKLAALWPFLGIVAEVVILCTIIFIYEKKRNKDAAVEEEADQDGWVLHCFPSFLTVEGSLHSLCSFMVDDVGQGGVMILGKLWDISSLLVCLSQHSYFLVVVWSEFL